MTCRNTTLAMVSHGRNNIVILNNSEYGEFRSILIIVAKNPLDSLAVIAKQEGQKLHRDLPERERRDTIEQQISKIEIEIDAEVGRKKQLESDLRSSTPIGIKTSGIEKNLEKCKERLNALTMLSMSYQAGMTDADTPED
jgi:hypothetical protein